MKFVLTSIRATASLGTFEILTKKLRNRNGGKPLPLDQVACCGFISGSTAALLWTPLESAVNKVGLTNLTYTNWLTTLCHTRLWRADTVALLIYTRFLTKFHYVESRYRRSTDLHSFLTKFHYATGFCLVQYTIFERFRRLELIK